MTFLMNIELYLNCDILSAFQSRCGIELDLDLDIDILDLDLVDFKVVSKFGLYIYYNS